MTQTVGNAVAQRDNTPAALIQQYSSDFKTVLPSHVRPDTWLRVAQGALKKGKKIESGPDRGMTELEVAARNNPGVFLASVLEAARLGLEPGTEQFYLTPRKVKGQLEILGIVGYQGHIELMYRAGAVGSVVAEVVRENDEYRYRRGIDEVPVHNYPSFAGGSTRGKLIGVYAYARMKDGSVSRVIELGRDDIARIKDSAQGANSEYSPWNKHEEAMWLKSAVRQLQKWVPTSAEYRDATRKDSAAVARAHAEGSRPMYGGQPLPLVDSEANDVVDAEVVPEGVDSTTGEMS